MAAPPDVRSVGLLGSWDDDEAAAIRSAAPSIAGVGADVDAVVAADPDLLVCRGHAAIRAAATSANVPILSVDGPPGTLSVDVQSLEGALEAVIAGEWRPAERRLLALEAGDGPLEALFEVALLVGPAGISEFQIETGEETGARLEIDRFRADGVVVATPTGSQGYAHAAGGAVLGPSLSAASVVPVAPFTIDPDHWVLEPPIWVTVSRDESEVRLVVDGDDRGAVTTRDPVRIDGGSHATLVAVHGAAEYYRRANRLEKT